MWELSYSPFDNGGGPIYRFELANHARNASYFANVRLIVIAYQPMEYFDNFDIISNLALASILVCVGSLDPLLTYSRSFSSSASTATTAAIATRIGEGFRAQVTFDWSGKSESTSTIFGAPHRHAKVAIIEMSSCNSHHVRAHFKIRINRTQNSDSHAAHGKGTAVHYPPMSTQAVERVYFCQETFSAVLDPSKLDLPLKERPIRSQEYYTKLYNGQLCNGQVATSSIPEAAANAPSAQEKEVEEEEVDLLAFSASTVFLQHEPFKLPECRKG